MISLNWNLVGHVEPSAAVNGCSRDKVRSSRTPETPSRYVDLTLSSLMLDECTYIRNYSALLEVFVKNNIYIYKYIFGVALWPSV